MTKEALKLALEALENNRQTHHYCEDTWYSCPKHEDGCANDSEGDECNCGADKANAEIDKAITAIKEALAQPEFIKHEVENADDWSEWVCPDPKNYLMKCCDCGLVHEAQFGVVRYKSETEREDCDIVDDPNLQAVFRIRRSEQWSPKDTAHRSGGLPMAQTEQEPVAWKLVPRDPTDEMLKAMDECSTEGYDERLYAGHAASVYMAAVDVAPAQPQRKPLTDEMIADIVVEMNGNEPTAMFWRDLARAIEAAHGIKGEA
jgi:hypothetical protein